MHYSSTSDLKYNVSVFFFCCYFLFVCYSFACLLALFCFIPEIPAWNIVGSMNICGLSQSMDDIRDNLYDVHEPEMAKQIYEGRKSQLNLEVERGEKTYLIMKRQ